jgi:hypothetical protein
VITYYGEFPFDEFECMTDAEALVRSTSKVLYREDLESSDGRPFVMLRDTVKYELDKL